MINCMGLMEMGQLIRRVREEKEPLLTQTELAYRIEERHRITLSQGWISKVELGQIENPEARKLRALAAELDIEPRALFARLFDIPYDGFVPVSPPSLPEDLLGLFDLQRRVEGRIRALVLGGDARAQPGNSAAPAGA